MNTIRFSLVMWSGRREWLFQNEMNKTINFVLFESCVLSRNRILIRQIYKWLLSKTQNSVYPFISTISLPYDKQPWRHTYILLHIHVHIYTYTHQYTHMHMHTYAHSLFLIPYSYYHFSNIYFWKFESKNNFLVTLFGGSIPQICGDPNFFQFSAFFV